ncbi:hypothetical protein [Qipengyuania nanhaisediminis]|uniref:hypothetical protein n=1 Tax=Qipengyuania nanhaisediminis TaxID=604088 RepID=UPI0038B268FF
MLALTLTCLFAIVAIATGLSLLDSWLRGRSVFARVLREKRLLDQGFVPQVHAHEVRLRGPARRPLAAASRPFAYRIPRASTYTAA